MAIDLYYSPLSAPCRKVMLVAAALDIKLNLIPLDLFKGEHLKPEFLKINPQHTIPTIVDGDFALWESHAISRYLVNKYGRESSLYPTEPQARALVDQLMDFDLATLNIRFGLYFYPQALEGAKPDEKLFKKLGEALTFLNTFLEGRKYAAGSALTIADLSLVATVSTIEVVGISLKEYPNIEKWLALLKSTAPNYEEANQKGAEDYKKFFAGLGFKIE